MLEVATRVQDRCVFIAVRGDLDHHGVLPLSSEMARVGDVAQLVVDLAGVERIDGAGLSLLRSRDEVLRSRGTRLVLWSPTPGVMRQLVTAGLDGAVAARDIPVDDVGRWLAAPGPPAPYRPQGTRQRRSR